MNKNIVLGLGLTLAIGAIACGDDNNNNNADSGVHPDAAVQMDGGMNNNPPAPPALGAQIDRMGRAGVNTAVTAPFNNNMSMREAAQDAYNQDAEKGTWDADYKASFAGTLAVYDGLDQTCGNQFAAGMDALPGRYDALAGVLADDQIYVNTAATTCTTYLAVEANATGIIPNQDCGGRTLEYDTIDVTYSVFAIGMVSGVGDGIANDSTFSATFPFLGAPQ